MVLHLCKILALTCQVCKLTIVTMTTCDPIDAEDKCCLVGWAFCISLCSLEKLNSARQKGQITVQHMIGPWCMTNESTPNHRHCDRKSGGNYCVGKTGPCPSSIPGPLNHENVAIDEQDLRFLEPDSPLIALRHCCWLIQPSQPPQNPSLITFPDASTVLSHRWEVAWTSCWFAKGMWYDSWIGRIHCVSVITSLLLPQIQASPPPTAELPPFQKRLS